MSIADVNWVFVVIAAVAQMVLGALWYSPLLFANLWLRLIGKKAEDIQADPTDYGFTFLGSLVTAFALSLVVEALYPDPELLDGALVGLVAWFGFRSPSTLAYTIFEGPPKPVWMLYIAYDLVALVIMGAIVTL